MAAGSKDTGKANPDTDKAKIRKERKARLKAALRANLRRRKSSPETQQKDKNGC